jgi:hypothetical protein
MADAPWWLFTGVSILNLKPGTGGFPAGGGLPEPSLEAKAALSCGSMAALDKQKVSRVIVPAVTCPETSRNCEAREKEDPE